MNRIEKIEKIEKIKKEIRKEINERGFICDSDNADRLIDELIEEYFEEHEVIEILNVLKEFMEKEYKKVYKVYKSGLYHGYYYRKHLSFNSPKELESHFLLGE